MKSPTWAVIWAVCLLAGVGCTDHTKKDMPRPAPQASPASEAGSEQPAAWEQEIGSGTAPQPAKETPATATRLNDVKEVIALLEEHRDSGKPLSHDEFEKVTRVIAELQAKISTMKKLIEEREAKAAKGQH